MGEERAKSIEGRTRLAELEMVGGQLEMGIRCRSTRDKDTDHASGLEANKNKKMVKNAKEKQDDEEDN